MKLLHLQFFHWEPYQILTRRMHVAPHVTKLQQEIILPDTNAVGTMSKFVGSRKCAVAKAVVKVVCNTSI